MSTQQRGSGWSIKLVLTLYSYFGYTFIYYLMYPVTFFYFIVAGNVKSVLKEYYQQINKPFNNGVYFHHLRHFAITMCDRFVSKACAREYTFHIEKEAELSKILSQGALLVLSHFGGWASAGNCLVGHKINIVMHEVLLREIKRIEEGIKSSQSNINLIDLSKGATNVAFEIASALLKNEIVAMMGDRATDDKNTQALLFFGKSANFNKNPFKIAYKTEKPVVSIFFIYESPQCYRIEFMSITMNKQNDQASEIKQAMQSYANFLASMVDKNPEQWFNFYPFWKETQ